MESTLEKIRPVLKEYGQEHILDFYPSLSPASKQALLAQISHLDFTLIRTLYQELVLHPESQWEKTQLSPLLPQIWDDFTPQARAGFWNHGLEQIRRGKAAAVVVAGGQGTRLGHSGPKGTFDIGLPSHKSLFQLQAERLISLARQAGCSVPWYIMTSHANHEITTEFFREHDYFGYSPEDCFFFQQDQLPVIDASGKILMSAPDQINLGPNGNGGCFLALAKSGALADMKRRGVEWVFLYGVDNALMRVCDPGLIGFAAVQNLPSVSKTVAKNSPDEKVGVLCYKNGRPAIIEYTEIPPELATERDDAGHLLYGNGNIMMHLFRRDFLEEHAASGLPYHVAHKRIPTIDAKGRPFTPDTPNGYKFELFMFDLFPFLEDMAALQIRREEEFAPVKNKEGSDSPDTARNLLFALHRRWLEAAGLDPRLLSGRDIEISPLRSFAGEGLDPKAISAYLAENPEGAIEIL